MKALQITQLGNDPYGVNLLDAAQRLERLDYRAPAPMFKLRADRVDFPRGG